MLKKELFKNLLLICIGVFLGGIYSYLTYGKKLKPQSKPVSQKGVPTDQIKAIQEMIDAAQEQEFLWLSTVLKELKSDKKENINQPDPADDLNTHALHQAIQLGSVDIVQFLLDQGANIEAKVKGATPALYMLDELNEEEREATIKGVMTPLHLAVRMGHLNIAQLLLERGANKEVKDEKGYTPLHTATLLNYKPIIQLLVNQGADLKAKDTKGNTPLHKAVVKGYTKIVKLFIKSGANIKAKNKEERDALFLAAINGRLHTAELLLKAGANINTKDFQSTKPLEVATWYGYKDLIQLLINNKANLVTSDRTGETPLHIAALTGDEDMANLLIDKGCDVNAKNYEGATPLHLAAYKGNIAIMKLLLNHGANIDAKHTTERENLWEHTPLGIAIYFNQEEAVQLLLQQGAHLNENTPLHQAINMRSHNIVKLLLKYGADPIITDKKDRTPMMLIQEKLAEASSTDEKKTYQAIIEMLKPYLTKNF